MMKILKHLEYILIIPLAIISIISGIGKNYILSLVGIYLLVQGICYIFLAINKNQAKILSSILSFINNFLGTIILLFFAISMLPEEAPLYYIIYVIIYLIFKIFTLIYYSLNKSDLNYVVYKEYAIVVIMQIINLIACILLYNFNQEETLDYMINLLVKIFVENYKEYDTVKFYLLLIKIAINFITSLFVAYYSTSSLISTIKQNKLSFKSNIKEVFNFFTRFELTFIFSEIFTIFIYIFYLIKGFESEYHLALSNFYLYIIIARLFIFIFHKIVIKKYKDNEFKIYKKDSLLLLIESSSMLIFYHSLSTVLFFISTYNDNNLTIPIWWLILIMLPFSSYGFINSVLTYKKAKRNNDPYLNSSANLSLVTSMYTLFGTIVSLISILDNYAVSIIWRILLIIIEVLLVIIPVRSLIKAIRCIKLKENNESNKEKNISSQ